MESILPWTAKSLKRLVILGDFLCRLDFTAFWQGSGLFPDNTLSCIRVTLPNAEKKTRTVQGLCQGEKVGRVRRKWPLRLLPW